MKKIYLSIILSLVLMFTGCSTVKNNSEESNLLSYNNGVCAFHYDSEKLVVSDVFELTGGEFIFDVDVKSDKIITGDSTMTFAYSNTGSLSTDDMWGFINNWAESNYHVSNKFNMATYTYEDSDESVVGVYTFDSPSESYNIKAINKWGKTLIVAYIERQDLGNNTYFEAVFDSVEYVGSSLKDEFITKYDV